MENKEEFNQEDLNVIDDITPEQILANAKVAAEAAQKDATKLYLENTEKDIRELRVDIDLAINSISLLYGSEEVTLCKRDLQRSKGFLGLILKEVGAVNPYPSSMDSSSSVIHNQAEHVSHTLDFPEALDRIGKVKFMRSAIEMLNLKIEILGSKTKGLPGKGMFFLQSSAIALVESKMWLGWELNEINEQSKKQ